MSSKLSIVAIAGGAKAIEAIGDPSIVSHAAFVKHAKRSAIALALSLTTCLDNPTYDQEIADKCGISLSDEHRQEALVDAGRVGSSVLAGRCRMTKIANGQEVSLTGGSSWD